MDGKALASTVTEYETSYQHVVSLVKGFSLKRGQVLKTAKFESQKRSDIPAVRIAT